MAVKKGLGKGLDSLITDKVNTKPVASKNNPTPKSEHAADAIMMNITKVEPNREQPRKKFDEDALLELAESIKQYGVLQPLLVQEREDYYEIVAGERRWRAARMAGISEVPAVIRELSDNEESRKNSRNQRNSCDYQETYQTGNYGDFPDRKYSEGRFKSN